MILGGNEFDKQVVKRVGNAAQQIVLVIRINISLGVLIRAVMYYLNGTMSQ